jgi:hypothetical protein
MAGVAPRVLRFLGFLGDSNVAASVADLHQHGIQPAWAVARQRLRGPEHQAHSRFRCQRRKSSSSTLGCELHRPDVMLLRSSRDHASSNRSGTPTSIRSVFALCAYEVPSP